MSPELLSAFVLFACVTLATPGPNNLMLMASGANYGFARTIPHMTGVAFGFPVMTVLIGTGLIRVFQAYPAVLPVLKAGAMVYLIWLAWKIAHAAAPGSATAADRRPFSFLQAMGFQWVNPKGWAMALTAITVYAPGYNPRGILIVAVIFLLIGMSTAIGWTMIGREIRRVLTNPARLRAFNWTMAVLLVGSLIPVLLGHG